MKKVALSLFTFLTGLVLAAVVLVNPLQWSWVEPFQHQVLSALQPSHDHTTATERQLWTCGMHPQVIQEEPGDCPICGMALTPLRESDPAPASTKATQKERKIKHWVAPMDPNYISDKPGKSPMGMDLVPVYEEEEEETAQGIVHIDPAFVQNIGVQSEPVERRDIPFTIRTIGTVTYNEKQMFLVNTKYAGWVENVRVNYVGEPVTKGQSLFDIYSPELVTTQKEYLDALDYAERMSASQYPDVLRRAQSLLNASRERLQYWDFTVEQIRELEKSRQPQRTVAVFSPSSGLVLEKMNAALEGMYVKPGMNVYKIVDLSTVWVDAEVFEDQLPWLKVGRSATLEFPSQPGRTYRGSVRYLYPYFNQKTRTMKVSIELANPGQKLRADMYAEVTFDVPSATRVLTVPEEAVIHSGKRNVVVLDRGDGTFQVNEVTLGVSGEGLWEVQDGVREGDLVVVSSQFLIDSESNLREAVRKMIASRQATDKTVPPSPSMTGHQH